MYTHCTDEVACLTIAIWSGVSSDADYLRAIEIFQHMDRVAAESGKKNVHIAIVQPGYPQPPAIWRKKIGDVNRGMVSREYDFALVTESAIIRGVFTAVRWLTGSREGYNAAAFGSFAEATAWVRRGSADKAYSQLESLHTELQNTLRVSSASAARKSPISTSP